MSPLAKRKKRAGARLFMRQTLRATFENHLNVFHADQHGLSRELATVCATNSSLVDRYFRAAGQATDLRSLRSPEREILERTGKTSKALHSPHDIDSIIEGELQKMPDEIEPVTRPAKNRRGSKTQSLGDFAGRAAQCRSALTSLALRRLDIREMGDLGKPDGVSTPILSEHYGREYAPNSRETFRRQTPNSLRPGSIIPISRTMRGRPAFQISEEAFQVILTFGQTIGRQR